MGRPITSGRSARPPRCFYRAVAPQTATPHVSHLLWGALRVAHIGARRCALDVKIFSIGDDGNMRNARNGWKADIRSSERRHTDLDLRIAAGSSTPSDVGRASSLKQPSD